MKEVVIKQSILSFIPQRFRLGSGYATTGKFNQYELFYMSLSLHSERDKNYPAVDFPEVLTPDHVAIFWVKDNFGFTLRAVNILGRLSDTDFNSFLDKWLAWSNHFKNSLNTKIPCLVWLAASSTPDTIWC